MKTLCISVKVKDYQIITDKAVKIICFDGSEAIIPKSQIFGPDFDSKKSDAYWIAAWILEKKDIQYSIKKQAYFDENRNKYDVVQVVRHNAPKMDPVSNNEIDELRISK